MSYALFSMQKQSNQQNVYENYSNIRNKSYKLG